MGISMEKIYEILNKKEVRGEIGLEVEAEGKYLPTGNLPSWNIEDDGSLRGIFPDTRAEYVFRKPLPINEVKEALKELFNEGVRIGTKWEFSYRCSTHVHLNILDLTVDELNALVYTYLLLEEPLVRYCGRERIHNRFALRTQDAEHTLEYISLLFQNGPKDRSLADAGRLRYAGLNLNAIPKYGSLEFRSMRGTSDIGVLSNWVEAIYCLKKFCKEKSVDVVKDMFIALDSEEFAKAVLSDFFKVFRYPKMNYDMRFGFSLSLPLTFVKAKAKAEKSKIYQINDF